MALVPVLAQRKEGRKGVEVRDKEVEREAIGQDRKENSKWGGKEGREDVPPLWRKIELST